MGFLQCLWCFDVNKVQKEQLNMLISVQACMIIKLNSNCQTKLWLWKNKIMSTYKSISNKWEAEDLEQTLKWSNIWWFENSKGVKILKPRKHQKTLISFVFFWRQVTIRLWIVQFVAFWPHAKTNKKFMEKEFWMTIQRY